MTNITPPPVEAELERLRHWHALEIEMVRAVTVFEHALLRPLFLLNGGALVAFLALIGSMRGSITASAIVALTFWVVGFVTALGATYCAARSQFRFRNLRGDQAYLAEKLFGLKPDAGLYGDLTLDELRMRIAKRAAEGMLYRKIAVALGIMSLVMFIFALVPAFLWTQIRG